VLLRPRAHVEGIFARGHLRRERCDARGHRGVVDLAGRSARRRGGGRGLQLGSYRIGLSAEGLSEHGQLAHFLNREGEPASDIGVEAGFEVEVDRYMQQRT
jgi:hypothetical protein